MGVNMRFSCTHSGFDVDPDEKDDEEEEGEENGRQDAILLYAWEDGAAQNSHEALSESLVPRHSVTCLAGGAEALRKGAKDKKRKRWHTLERAS